MTKDKIVAVGLLTEHDVRVLGQGFNRLFPVEDASSFDDLIAALDEIGEVDCPTDKARSNPARRS